MSTEYESKNKKRKRLTNQISSGILDETNVRVRDVYPTHGEMNFVCVSKDRSTSHNIKIYMEDNKIKFECDCNEYMDKKKTLCCMHLNSTIIELCKKFIDFSASAYQEKEIYIDTKRKINVLNDIFSDMTI